MMTPKEKAIQIILRAVGDNLERATLAFKGLDIKEMQKEHGRSGKTRYEIFEEYKQERQEVLAALEWVKTR